MGTLSDSARNLLGKARPFGERAPLAGSFDVFGVTHPGRERERNEDAFLVVDLVRLLVVSSTSLHLADRRTASAAQGLLVAVADGVAGTPGGELASVGALDSLAANALHVLPWARGPELDRDAAAAGLRAGIVACNEALVQHSGRSGEALTTLTAALLIDDQLIVGHVGDTRCYLHHEGRLELLTADHNLAALFAGERHDAERLRHIVYNVLGRREPGGPRVDTALAKVGAGDAVLVCSDGLTCHLDDDTIAAELARGAPAELSARALVDAANAAGGSDNITVVIARRR
jgi:protein phosphatase